MTILLIMGKDGKFIQSHFLVILFGFNLPNILVIKCVIVAQGLWNIGFLMVEPSSIKLAGEGRDNPGREMGRESGI